ncbi:MAG TPA: J domain-containing protein [Terracidiphilus sp.]|nr:J domain-containing protein [Terracidiphilus sp.]
MTICSCGNEAEEDGTQCARCAALKQLDLAPCATGEEIKNAFQALANTWRPDLFPQQLRAEVEEKWQKIDAAYSYLSSGMEQQPQNAVDAQAKQEPAETADPATEPERESPHRTEWRGMLPSRVWTIPMPIALGFGVIVLALMLGWFLLGPLDSILQSNPVTARFAADYKESVLNGFGNLKNRIRDEAASILHLGGSHPPIAVPPPTQQPELAPPAGPPPARRKPSQPRPDVRYVLPYITAGLSKTEVIAAQGKPTEETETMLTYGKSELYFRNDQLIGWKIDPASSPIRVKLWPDATVDPDLDSFGVGSSKNEVIVVQGTPTFFSENTFGYRGSEVYFKNNRVVGWKTDLSSPLRTEDR